MPEVKDYQDAYYSMTWLGCRPRLPDRQRPLAVAARHDGMWHDHHRDDRLAVSENWFFDFVERRTVERWGMKASPT